uniref:Activin_recp domain-containing protein n=1 Tax=Panagrellus redivivus TaxID=6233 RepID=A0A7E4VHG3_PANRE
MRVAVFVVFSSFVMKTLAISCYDCRSDDSTCNTGACQGAICVKMETANLDNERRTVHKSCSDEFEETQCKQSTFGSKMIIRCTCDSGAFCNGEDALMAAGLIANSAPMGWSLGVFGLCFGAVLINVN